MRARSVLIGVQARTNSTRLPNKANMQLAGKALIEHVMDNCIKASDYLNRNFNRYSTTVNTAMLIPGGDKLGDKYGDKYRVFDFPDTPEWDVLSRYYHAKRSENADYVVRITGDCVFTAPYLVSRCVKAALFGGHDYVSNVLIRTFREGMDVEVISSRLMDWLNEHAKANDAREHVTSLLQMRGAVPRHMRFCHVLNDVDDSDRKTSIDTKEDFDRAAGEFDSLRSKSRQATANGDSIS